MLLFPITPADEQAERGNKYEQGVRHSPFDTRILAQKRMDIPMALDLSLLPPSTSQGAGKHYRKAQAALFISAGKSPLLKGFN